MEISSAMVAVWRVERRSWKCGVVFGVEFGRMVGQECDVTAQNAYARVFVCGRHEARGGAVDRRKESYAAGK